MGNDVTDRYVFNPVTRSVITLKRPIKIESLGAEKTYDGLPLTKHECDITSGSLAYDDKIVAEYTGTITSAGKEKNEFTLKILNSEGVDVTSFYTVVTAFGDLTVHKRHITVESESGEYVYDGLNHTFESFKVVGEVGLAGGERASAHEWASIIDVGKIENTFTLTVLDSLGHQVTDNYVIDYIFGEIVVDKRNITVTTPSESKTYMGEFWSNTELVCDALGYGDEIVIGDFATIKYVGSTSNKVEFSIFNSVRDKDVSENYNITVVEGVLTVTPRPVHIISGGGEMEYNGTAITSTEVTVSDVIGEGMVDGHTIKVESSTFVKNVSDSADNVITVKIYEEDKDVTENFLISYEWGRLTVKPREIRVITLDKDLYFNKEAQFSHEATIDNLVPGHTFKVISSTKLTYPGKAENIFEEYDILDADGVSVKDNYNVIFEYGTLNILKRPITVSSGSAEKIYDATPLTAKYWEVAEDSICDLLPGDRISASLPYGSQTNVGSSANEYNSVIKIFDEDGNNITRYYEITEVAGTLTVHPRPIKVKTADGTAIYDDKDHSFKSVTVITEDGGYGLCAGHRMVSVNVPLFRYVSDSGENTLSVEIYSGNTNISYNYEISYVYGKVEIKPRPITIKTNDIAAVYDDKDHYDSTVNVVGEYSLCKSHYIEVLEYSVFHDTVLGAENAVSIAVKRDGADLTENYLITPIFGNVDIKPRPITIETESFNGMYDGLPHGGKWKLLVTEYGLCSGHTIDVLSSVVYTDVVEKAENIIEVAIIKNGTDDVTHNYEITFIIGKITITPRIINIITGSKTWNFDGAPHSHKEYRVEDISFVDFHEVKISRATSITFVGTKDNHLEFTVFDENKVNVTHNYSINIVEYGQLEIVGNANGGSFGGGGDLGEVSRPDVEIS